MKNKSLLFLAAILFISVFLNVNIYAKEESSILERVRKVENPELAELIEIAINNLPESKLNPGSSQQEHSQLQYEIKIAKSKAIRIVTEKFAQIKLLDEKIKQIEKKQILSKNEDIKAELLIVKASLETERLSNIAELREALHLVPRTPFGSKEIDELNTWIHLEVFDDEIRLFNFQKPFLATLNENSSKEPCFKSPVETLAFIENIIKQKHSVPIRITFAKTEKGRSLANNLKDKIKIIIQNNNLEYETELAKTISLNEKPCKIIIYHGAVLENSINSKKYSLYDYLRNKREALRKPGTLPLELKIECLDSNHTEWIEQIKNFYKGISAESNLKAYILVE